MRNVWLIVCAGLIWFMGCSKDQNVFVPADPPVLAKDPPVIVRLESKHETIVIKSGPTGPLYSVITSDGVFVVRDVSLAQLELNNPRVYRRVKSAIVESHAGLGRQSSPFSEP